MLIIIIRVYLFYVTIIDPIINKLSKKTVPSAQNSCTSFFSVLAISTISKTIVRHFGKHLGIRKRELKYMLEMTIFNILNLFVIRTNSATSIFEKVCHYFADVTDDALAPYSLAMLSSVTSA